MIKHLLKTVVISSFLAAFGFIALSYGTIQEIPPINFGGGVDYKNDCSDIADNRACDMNNMISDFLGTTSKRFGSHKIVEQAISSFTTKGLYRAYYSTGSTIFKATMMINYGKIYVDTTTSSNLDTHIWSERKSGLDKNQNYEFKQYGSLVLIAGDSLNDSMMEYNIVTDSVTEAITPTNSGVVITAKHHIFSKDYYILANIKNFTDGTTFYNSRVQYSMLLDTAAHISSMTVLRQFDVSDDGEEITGMGEIDNVQIFKPTSISELSFSALNLTALGGDQALTKLVSGFGCISP